MIQTWPSDIPVFERDSYGFDLQDPLQRSPTEEGAFAVRRRSGVAGVLIEGAIRCSGDQAETIRLFWANAVRHGAEAFLLPVYVGNEWNLQTVMFAERPGRPRNVGPDRWAVGLKFVTIDNQLGPARWADLTYANGSDPVGMAEVAVPSSGSWRPWRVDVFVRTAFVANGGGSVTLKVGWTGATTALVNSLTVSSATPHHLVVAGSSAAGSVISGATAQTVARTILCELTGAGALTAGDLTVVARYRLT